MKLCGCEFELVEPAATYGWDRFPTKGAGPSALRSNTSAIALSSESVARIGDVGRKGAAELPVATDRRDR